MSRRNRRARIRKHRRANRLEMRSPGAAPKHRGRSGRTGKMHFIKLKSRRKP